MRFEVDNDMDANGTSLRAHYTIAPAKLVELLGEPGEATIDGKVSGQYYFYPVMEGDDDVERHGVVTLYDWKSTTLYGEDAPTPYVFWSSWTPYQFHIGGKRHSAVHDFTDWLEALEAKTADG